MSKKPDHTLRLFISYARVDFLVAERIRLALLQSGYEAYLDKHDILPGEAWQERLSGLIIAADVVLFVMSPDSIASKMCDWEVNESERLAKKIVPIVVRNVDHALVPPRLKRLNYIFLTQGDDFDAEFAKLKAALNTNISWLREHTRLTDLANAWQERKRPRELLLRGRALRDAETWSMQRSQGIEPSSLQIEFVNSSKTAERSRTKAAIIALATVTAMTVAGGLYAWSQKIAADAARNQTEAVLERGRSAASDTIVGLFQKYGNTTSISQELMGTVVLSMMELVNSLQTGAGTRPGLEQAKAIAQIELSRIRRIGGDGRGAEDIASQAVATLSKISVDDPTLPGVKQDLLAAYDRLGEAEMVLQERSQAKLAFEKMLSIAKSLDDAKPDDPNGKRQLATAFEKSARLDLLDGNYQSAIDRYSSSLSIRRSLESRLADPALAREIGVSEEGLGDTYFKMGEIDKAFAHYDEGLKIATELSVSNPSTISFAEDRAARLEKLAECLLRNKATDEAIRRFRLAIEIRKSLSTANPGLSELVVQIITASEKTAASLHDSDLSAAISTLRESHSFVELHAPKRANAKLDQAHALSVARLAKFIEESGDPLGAADDIELSVSLMRRAHETEPSQNETTLDLIALYDVAARYFNKHFTTAESAEKALAFTEARLELIRHTDASADIDRLARALGDRSWYAVFARRYSVAISSVDEATRLYDAASRQPPSWLMINKVYAELYSDQRVAAERTIAALNESREELVKLISQDADMLSAAGFDVSAVWALIDAH